MAVYETNVPGATIHARGKVRDVYDLGDRLAVVATDRISCFDVVLPTPIPDKGRILTRISRFWFDFIAQFAKHHLISTELSELPAPFHEHAELEGRVMLCHKCDVFPVECIVRGYLAGSGAKEYAANGTVCGIALPEGLSKFSKLPEPIFTPSTKAERGEHDENITFDEMCERIGGEWAEKLRDRSLQVYSEASKLAAEKGVILADTKFEWGQKDGELYLIDEVLTPDSSRFWPASTYKDGEFAESFDKQYVRDWLIECQWNKTPPAPELPEELVARTRSLYVQVVEMLTGETFE